MKKIFFLISCVLVLSYGCKDAQWVVKQKNKELKYRYAYNFFNKGKFIEAVPVIEDLLNYYKGTDTAERLYFMLAESYFYGKEYMVAAYHLKTFRDLYPKSYKSEVASFKIAECYKKEIPRLDLEQTDTEKAISYFNSFLSDYPQSAMAELAEQHLKDLKRILELKALEAANLYYQTKNYRAAAVTYKNVLNQYPNIAEYEELMYKVGMSYYKFAEKSITSKQSERYEIALNANQNFINRFPNSKFLAEAKFVSDECKVKILESAIKNANTYYNILERPLYYSQSLELYEEFSPEIKKMPPSLQNFKNKCFLGILKSYYVVVEDAKDVALKSENYKLFLENYYRFIEKFTSKSDELYQAEEMFRKINQYYKS